MQRRLLAQSCVLSFGWQRRRGRQRGFDKQGQESGQENSSRHQYVEAQFFEPHQSTNY
jgi:hypothetical protein